MLDIGNCFEYASGIKYARVMNMLRYNYNKIIIIVTNFITLDLLSARFVLPGAPQLTMLSFLTRVRAFY